MTGLLCLKQFVSPFEEIFDLYHLPEFSQTKNNTPHHTHHADHTHNTHNTQRIQQHIRSTSIQICTHIPLCAQNEEKKKRRKEEKKKRRKENTTSATTGLLPRNRITIRFTSQQARRVVDAPNTDIPCLCDLMVASNWPHSNDTGSRK